MNVGPDALQTGAQETLQRNVEEALNNAPRVNRRAGRQGLAGRRQVNLAGVERGLPAFGERHDQAPASRRYPGATPSPAARHAPPPIRGHAARRARARPRASSCLLLGSRRSRASSSRSSVALDLILGQPPACCALAQLAPACRRGAPPRQADAEDRPALLRAALGEYSGELAQAVSAPQHDVVRPLDAGRRRPPRRTRRPPRSAAAAAAARAGSATSTASCRAGAIQRRP